MIEEAYSKEFKTSKSKDKKIKAKKRKEKITDFDPDKIEDDLKKMDKKVHKELKNFKSSKKSGHFNAY